MADPKLRVFLLGTIVLSCFGSIVLETNGADSRIPVTVNRRPTGDIITLSSENTILCNNDDNLTYLVSERQCVRNQGLLNGCMFSIAPSQQHSNITLTILIRTPNQRETLLMTPEAGSILTEAVVVHRTTTHQSVNSSSCSISSLEVYRGKQQAFEIAHDGLSLKDNGTIKLDMYQIRYHLEDYEGELYRMNLSCSGGRLPESGCLFFKVIGMTNVTKAKFNESVTGTLRDTDFLTTTTKLSNGNTSPSYSHSTLSTTGISMILNPSDQASGPDLFIYIIVAATGIVALLFVVVLLCMVLVYCCSVEKKRNHGQGSGVTVATNLWFEQRDLIVLNNPPGPPYDVNTLETVQ